MPSEATIYLCLFLGAVACAIWLAARLAAARARLAALAAERDAADSAAEMSRDAAEEERRRCESHLAELGVASAEIAALKSDLRALGEQGGRELEYERKILAERELSLRREREAIEARHKELSSQTTAVFDSIANEHLRRAGEQLLNLAQSRLGAASAQSALDLERRQSAVDELVRPLREGLAATQAMLQRLESQRASADSSIAEQVRAVAAGNAELRRETATLVRALARPEVRGRYGETQLRRVVELAGMAAYCDFDEQASSRDSDGRLKRPDLVVRLPSDRVVVVDAKTSTDAYVRAITATTSEEREAFLDQYALNVEQQIMSLAAKGYWRDFQGSPAFTVMFIPGDQFLDGALARRADLLELAAERSIILTSPSSLIGLLKAVELGWREHHVAMQTRELQRLGRQLHERAGILTEKLNDLGNGISRVVERFNSVIATFDSRFRPALRAFEDAGARSEREVQDLPSIVIRPQRPIAQPVEPIEVPLPSPPHKDSIDQGRLEF